jgi:hypothetical protein
MLPTQSDLLQALRTLSSALPSQAPQILFLAHLELPHTATRLLQAPPRPLATHHSHPLNVLLGRMLVQVELRLVQLGRQPSRLEALNFLLTGANCLCILPAKYRMQSKQPLAQQLRLHPRFLQLALLIQRRSSSASNRRQEWHPRPQVFHRQCPHQVLG